MATNSLDDHLGSASDLGESNPTAPGLTRLGLSLLLLAVVTVPPTLVLSLWWILPKPQEARLPADLVLTTADNSPIIALTNRSEGPIANVAINLNGAFHHYAALPLEEGETLTVPLSAFVRKNGLRFDPEKTGIRKVGVYAQLAGGARGVLVLKGGQISSIQNPPPIDQD